MSTKRIGLFLEPLDVLFFRDGRPFEPALAGQSGLPAPQTLAGSVWTALLEKKNADYPRLAAAVKEGKSFEKALQAIDQPAWLAHVAVRGPWLAKAKGKDLQDVFVPVPAVLHRLKGADKNGNNDGKLMRLFPLQEDQLAGWQPPRPGMRPLWLQSAKQTEPATGFLGKAALSAFLSSQPVHFGSVIKKEDLYDFDNRTGIVIDPESLATEEGKIYGARFLVLKEHVGFYAEVVLPDQADDNPFGATDTITFGGERRRVRVHLLPESWSWPEAVAQGDRQKPLTLLSTPGIFQERWFPNAFDKQMTAAAVPGDQPVSGWDLARGGPKPNRFAAQAGSVYFLNQPLDHWPAALSDDPFDRQQGWGCYLKGVWIDD